MISGKSAIAPRRAGVLFTLLFLLVGWSVSLVPGTAVAGFDPFEATIGELNRAFDEGRLTSEELVRYYLDRIEAFEDKGPEINALITINPKALDRARTGNGWKRAREACCTASRSS